MKSRCLNDSYRVVCLIFAGIILAIFAYSFIFGSVTSYPIPSGSQVVTGTDSPSTGLSRSFSAIVRFNFTEARSYNPYGIRIFLFFLIQLFMRAAGIVLAGKVIQRCRIIIISDIMLSIILFFICFWPFIKVLSARLR